MEIQTQTETTLVIRLTEAEAHAALHNTTALKHAILRALLPDADPAPSIARRKKANRRRVGTRSPRPKAKASKTMTCTTCGKVYKQLASFKRHVSKHTAMPVDAS